MDLGRLVKDKRQELTAWFPFADFEVELPYVDPPAMRRMTDACRDRSFDRRTHLQKDDLDNTLLREALAGQIRNWRGLTLGEFAKLVPIDIGGEDPTAKIPCTEANKQVLCSEVYSFAEFVRQSIMDLQAFRAREVERQTKNLKTSQRSGSTSTAGTPAKSADEPSPTE